MAKELVNVSNGKIMACEPESTLIKIKNPLASKTPPRQPPKRKSRAEDGCFSCKKKRHWTYDCPDNDGRCFVCKERGHWYKQCPIKVPQRTHTSSPGGGSSSTSTSALLLRCHCGRKCVCLTCRKGENNGRKFYACPDYKQPGDCKFFKWCEDLSTFKVTECPSGAGACSLNMKSCGEHAGWYYGCRLKQSQRACNFSQCADPQTMQTNGDEVECNASPVDNFYSDHQVPNRHNTVKRNLFHYFERVSTTEGSSSKETRNDETPNGNLVAEAPESNALMVRQAPSVASQADMINQRGEVRMQFTAATADVYAHLPLEGARRFSSMLNLNFSGRQISSIDVYGWLGRLEHLRCLRDIPTLRCGCMFPSLDPVRIPEGVNISCIKARMLESNGISYTETVVPSKQTSQQDDPLTSDSIPVSNNGIVGVSHADNSLPKSVLKQFGGTLLNILESMEHQKHEQMLEIAEATFDMLCKCSIYFEVFRENVLQYIECASMVSRLEVSMRKDVSSQELIDKYNLEKVYFDDVFHNHAKAKDSYEASSSCILSLEKEVSRAKATMNKLEERLSIFKAENAELEARVVETISEMSVSERKLEARHKELELALDLKQQRESTLDAGKAALENARSCFLLCSKKLCSVQCGLRYYNL